MNFTKAKCALALVGCLLLAANSTHATEWEQSGNASYYGVKHQGKKTANGERFDANQLTAAHPSLPFGTRVKVTCVSTGKSVIVRINDRGPFHGGRVIDLSKAAAKKIDMVKRGVMKIKLQRLD